MAETNRLVCLARRPEGRIAADDLVLTELPLAPLAEGEALVRNTWLSIDPSVRIRLAATTPKGYLPPLRPGDPLAGLALGEVVASRRPDFAVGELVSHTQGFRDYALLGADAAAIGGYGSPAVVRTGGLPAQWFLGPLGSAGLTAYAGLFGVLELRPADTVWISAAAGAVGSLAAQLAKLRGATVIGSAGGAAKTAFLRDELGITAVDYRAGSLTGSLTAAAPDGIDAYFDNVGGDHLAAALDVLNPGGRIALCGAVSAYDGAPAPAPADLFPIVAKQLRLQGFRAGSFLDLDEPMRAEIGDHLAAGRLVHRETVFEGLHRAPAALVAMLSGATVGKTLCHLP
ncbi:NADP-dependent oxidoreductase [Nocardia sp. NPDC057353]|uniref:NADP-dependent oxidoreductase n=1 Tax=Nocardia sp. NPDC057353 TaxID=3346104 RepID=UPI0036342155